MAKKNPLLFDPTSANLLGAIKPPSLAPGGVTLNNFEAGPGGAINPNPKPPATTPTTTPTTATPTNNGGSGGSGSETSSSAVFQMPEFANFYAGLGGTYKSQYADDIQAKLDEILNGKDFSYNFDLDPLYQQYRERYLQQGDLAMQKAMAMASAKTGGYGSSYGQQVGQQTYQGYMTELNDMIPELRSAKYGEYSDNRANMYNQAGLLQDLDNAEYARWAADRDYELQLAQLQQNQANYAYELMMASMGSKGSSGGGGGGGNGTEPATYAEGLAWIQDMMKNGKTAPQVMTTLSQISQSEFAAGVYYQLMDYITNLGGGGGTKGRGNPK